MVMQKDNTSIDMFFFMVFCQGSFLRNKILWMKVYRDYGIRTSFLRIKKLCPPHKEELSAIRKSKEEKKGAKGHVDLGEVCRGIFLLPWRA